MARFLRTARYERGFADSLLDCTRDGTVAWPLRAAAALILEHQLLRVRRGDSGEELDWIAKLGCQGVAFAELRSRMARLARIHDAIGGTRTTPAALDDFLHVAERDCRITIGRYLWSPDETLKRIDAQVRRSRGTPATGAPPHGGAFEEASRHLARLPPYERAIVEGLMSGLRIRWVAPATSGEINSLVENPIGSVVLVVKPPGSTLEIEIKRGGVRGPRPLDVVVRRDGEYVPRWHHLHGGSMEQLLLAEAGQSAFFSQLFRVVHGEDATMSRTLQVALIGALPEGVHPLDYFSSCDPRELDTASNILSGRKRLSPTPLRAALRFIGVSKPAQAIEIGNSSFRLDRLVLYLSRRGAAAYFSALGWQAGPDDARRFADEILDEVLCVYKPPPVAYRNHGQYVAAAFAAPANRARATTNFLSAMKELGRFWGTLFASGGHSDGESFVGRNTALRTVWDRGRWRIAFISLDHDAMFLAGRNAGRFRPRTSLGHARGDHRFIFRRLRGELPKRGTVTLLNRIYHTDRALRAEGEAALKDAARTAFDKTRAALRHSAALRSLFDAHYLDQLETWHEFMRGYIGSIASRPRRRAWRREAETLLRATGYGEKMIAESIGIMRRHAPFIRAIAFLYATP